MTSCHDLASFGRTAARKLPRKQTYILDLSGDTLAGPTEQEGTRVMRNRMRLLFALPLLATGLAVASAPQAQAQWHHGGYGGYHGGGWHHPYYGGRGYGYGRGHGYGGALVGGLAAGAVLGALGAGLVAPPPAVVYAPPPVVYAAPPPVVYAAPPPPGYYQGYGNGYGY